MNSNSYFRCGITLGLLACFSFMLVGCSKGGQAEAAPGERKTPAVPVVVEGVTSHDVPIRVQNIGNVLSPKTVGLTSRVGGEIIKVNFTEGQEVQAGDVLIEIDPRPFEMLLKQAEVERDRQMALRDQAQANLQRDKAELENAIKQRDRNQSLVDEGIVARTAFDTLDVRVRALEATVAADESAVQSATQSIRSAATAIEDAKLQFSYCTLTAPIQGRAGGLLVDQGNIVQANSDTPLVTINQIRPIEVAFSLPERYLNTVAQRMREGTMSVVAAVPNLAETATTGTLTFLDNQVDSQTGMFRLKAVFENDAELLWPGQFVNVSLTLNTIQDAVIVSRRAVLDGQKGTYAYVVKADKTVETRMLETGESAGDEIIIRKGLQPGERVVVDGQLSLKDGTLISEKQDLGEGL